jgi:hypothetical protein
VPWRALPRITARSGRISNASEKPAPRDFALPKEGAARVVQVRSGRQAHRKMARKIEQPVIRTFLPGAGLESRYSRSVRGLCVGGPFFVDPDRHGAGKEPQRVFALWSCDLPSRPAPRPGRSQRKFAPVVKLDRLTKAAVQPSSASAGNTSSSQ